MRFNFLLIFFLPIACAYPQKTTTFKTIQPKHNKAVVYLYRLPTHVHSFNPDVPKFYIGDKVIGKLTIGGYYALLVPSGKIDLTYKTPLFGIYFPWKSGRLTINPQISQATFVKFQVSYSMGPATVFEQVPSHIGATEIEKTFLLK